MVSESKMREILFRGKRTKNGEWVEGLLFHHCEKASSIYSDKLDRAVWVIPETVGQFTGLTDKNGKKIFEGDVVRYMNKETMVVSYYSKCASFVIAYSAVNFVYSANLMHSNIYLEVIGNIYDNPELLEVSNA